MTIGFLLYDPLLRQWLGGPEDWTSNNKEARVFATWQDAEAERLMRDYRRRLYVTKRGS